MDKRHVNNEIKKILEDSKEKGKLEVYVVLSREDRFVEVVSVYLDEDEANKRVEWERGIVNGQPLLNKVFWYQSQYVHA